MGHARALINLPSEVQQLKIFPQIIDKDLSGKGRGRLGA